MYIGTNFPNSAEYSAQIEEQINAGLDPFRAIAEAGLDYVELSCKQNTVNRDALEADVTRLRELGIQANFHPYFNCKGFGTKLEPLTLRPSVMTVLQIARNIAQDEGRSVVMNYHAASSHTIMERTDLLQHSHHFYTWLMESVTDLAADVIITTEHQLPPNPDSTIQRIGDSFDELLALKAQNKHSRFGICWDMGHSTMRHLYYRNNPIPTPNLLKQVKHVHIHDVNYQRFADHRAIGTENAPLRKYVHILQKAGYTGGFTMEYDANEFFGSQYAGFLTRSKNTLLDMDLRA